MGGMAGPANLHQIRFLGRGLLEEMADEIAELRKETMSRIDGRVVGHGMYGIQFITTLINYFELLSVPGATKVLDNNLLDCCCAAERHFGSVTRE